MRLSLESASQSMSPTKPRAASQPKPSTCDSQDDACKPLCETASSTNTPKSPRRRRLVMDAKTSALSRAEESGAQRDAATRHPNTAAAASSIQRTFRRHRSCKSVATEGTASQPDLKASSSTRLAKVMRYVASHLRENQGRGYVNLQRVNGV